MSPWPRRYCPASRAGRLSVGQRQLLPRALRSDRVAAEFNVDAAAWATVCKRSALQYDRLAALSFDRAERIAWRDRYVQAAHAIEAGTPPSSIGLPGLGTAE